MAKRPRSSPTRSGEPASVGLAAAGIRGRHHVPALSRRDETGRDRQRARCDLSGPRHRRPRRQTSRTQDHAELRIAPRTGHRSTLEHEQSAAQGDRRQRPLRGQLGGPPWKYRARSGSRRGRQGRQARHHECDPISGGARMTSLAQRTEGYETSDATASGWGQDLVAPPARLGCYELAHILGSGTCGS
jgi:hypothetical protein